jgi:hypothetical protein
MFFLNLYHLGSAASFVLTAHSGQIISKSVKRNWSMCRLKFSPRLKRSWVTLHFWTSCSCSLVWNQFVPSSDTKYVSSFQPKFMFPSCIQIAISFVLLTRASRIRMWWKPEEVTYDIGFQSFLSFHFNDGQDFKLPKSLHSVQNRISAARSIQKPVTFKPLIVWGHVNIYQKAENVFYNDSIESFLRFHLFLG